ncbi:hypothetical protein AVEN_41992-1 [Araneus ventricosus]|uniref:Uncharacterized protein n=1 Tax=Araneus ventricosus TaxID=182803 RepID=A0A4Y2WGF7_ARAVE|nr:hypothetical protein AVEN_41992-1 [Araneus ventricosus]
MLVRPGKMQLDARSCEAYYSLQQTGGNVYFKGVPYQRGYGLFGDFRRFITPMIIRAGKYLGGQLLRTGENILTDVSEVISFRDSARDRSRETSGRIKDDIFQKLQHGKDIKRKHLPRISQSKNKTRSKKKRKGAEDIFS